MGHRDRFLITPEPLSKVLALVPRPPPHLYTEASETSGPRKVHILNPVEEAHLSTAGLVYERGTELRSHCEPAETLLMMAGLV